MNTVGPSIPRHLVSVEHHQPVIHIDQSEAFADRGSLSPLEFTARGVALGRQVALAGIARRAQEGEQLEHIEEPGGSIAAVVRAAHQPGWTQLTLVALPAHRPRVDVDPGYWRWELDPPPGLWLDTRA